MKNIKSFEDMDIKSSPRELIEELFRVVLFEKSKKEKFFYLSLLLEEIFGSDSLDRILEDIISAEDENGENPLQNCRKSSSRDIKLNNIFEGVIKIDNKNQAQDCTTQKPEDIDLYKRIYREVEVHKKQIVTFLVFIKVFPKDAEIFWDLLVDRLYQEFYRP
ncbi:hypothetical protein HZA38_03075 [Candidatus Peregrinibacteria bacterium]|nr:hypothetical protein [Candidatus Peregrinibacteria bacterium]